MSVLVPRESLESSIQHLADVRYLTIIGFTILTYDIFLSFSTEVDLVWSSRRWSAPKIAYLFNRYATVILVFFYLLTEIIPFRTFSNEWCQNSGPATVLIDAFVETMGNGVVLYELIRLWNTKRAFAWIMAFGFILMHCITIAFVGVTIAEMRGKLVFAQLENFQVCVISDKPKGLLGVYIPAVSLDVYAFTLLLINALSRPRSSSQQLLDLLYKDGIIFFFTTMSMRLICLLFNVAGPVSLAVSGLVFPTTLVSAAVSRLYLRLHGTCVQQQPQSLENMYGISTLVVEETELRVRRMKSKDSRMYQA